MLKKKGLQSSGSSKTPPPPSPKHILFVNDRNTLSGADYYTSKSGRPSTAGFQNIENKQKQKHIFLNLSFSLSYTLLKPKLLSETSQFLLCSSNLFFFLNKLKKVTFFFNIINFSPHASAKESQKMPLL